VAVSCILTTDQHTAADAIDDDPCEGGKPGIIRIGTLTLLAASTRAWHIRIRAGDRVDVVEQGIARCAPTLHKDRLAVAAHCIDDVQARDSLRGKVLRKELRTRPAARPKQAVRGGALQVFVELAGKSLVMQAIQKHGPYAFATLSATFVCLTVDALETTGPCGTGALLALTLQALSSVARRQGAPERPGAKVTSVSTAISGAVLRPTV